MKKKVKFGVWGITIVVIVSFVIMQVYDNIQGIEIICGWLLWLYLLICYPLTAMTTPHCLKYLPQIALLICGYDYYTNNSILPKEKMLMVIIVLTIVTAIVLSIGNGKAINEKYIEKDIIQKVIERRVDGKIRDDEKKQKIDLHLVNNLTVIILVAIGIVCSTLAGWVSWTWLLLIIGGSLFAAINLGKYRIAKMSQVRYVADMLCVVIGYCILFWFSDKSIDFPLLLMQLYCYTPFLLTAMKIRLWVADGYMEED